VKSAYSSSDSRVFTTRLRWGVLYRFGIGCKPPFTYHKKFSYLLAISGAKERKNFSPVGNLFAAQAA
jgi:hypothetical protein